MESLIFFAVSLFASLIGALCGIGGGVIIKPVLDLLALESAAAISFLSGCTVLAMSCYSVLHAFFTGSGSVDTRRGTPLALGAALGGLAGNRLFAAVQALAAGPETVGAVQSLCLAAVTAGALVCTLLRCRVRLRCGITWALCAAVGLFLGMISSFLGIGGGPINLAVLYLLFGMNAKAAVANSLYIILFGQAANLAASLLTGSVPPFRWETLCLMAAGGIGGGVIGRMLDRRLSGRSIEVLYLVLMVVLIAVSIWNFLRSVLF